MVGKVEWIFSFKVTHFSKFGMVFPSIFYKRNLGREEFVSGSRPWEDVGADYTYVGRIKFMFL